MEGPHKITHPENKNILEDKEIIFDSLVIEEIINGAFVKSLEEAGFEKEEVDAFLSELAKFDTDSIKGILAIPKELRDRNFPRYKQIIDKGETNIEEILQKLDRAAKENGYTLGYHASKTDIPNDTENWDVKGTELDDRDNRPMAYYSLDYKDIYRVDRGNILYVVRAQTGKNTPHKLDTSNNWGRADSLSVVHKIDMVKIDNQIEEKLKEIREMRRDAA